MKLILLIVAVVLFILGALSVAGINWLAWGLAAFAASFLPLPETIR